jgi:hypothetical protein
MKAQRLILTVGGSRRLPDACPSSESIKPQRHGAMQKADVWWPIIRAAVIKAE